MTSGAQSPNFMKLTKQDEPRVVGISAKRLRDCNQTTPQGLDVELDFVRLLHSAIKATLLQLCDICHYVTKMCSNTTKV